MAPVAVVTDTTHYAPAELFAAEGIHQVSLYVNEGGDLTRESAMPDFGEFFFYLAVIAIVCVFPRGLLGKA